MKTLKPDELAEFTQAQAIHRQGRVADAAAVYRRLLVVAPEHAELLFLAGTAELQLGAPDRCVPLLQQALTLAPQLGGARSNLAVALQRLGRNAEALAVIDTALAALPAGSGGAPLHLNRANILSRLERFDEALAAYGQALALSPGYAEAFNNRGALLRELGRPAEALADYDKAVALNPRYSEAFNNRGTALRDLGDVDGAYDSFRRALALNSGNNGARWQLGTMQLLRGDFEQGWRNFQARWQSPLMQPFRRTYPVPQWLGEVPPAGKTLLIYAEQGLGDTVQFSRYVPMLISAGANVVLDVPETLVPLLQTLPGSPQVIASGGALPPFDGHCSMMSLPLAMATRLDTIPSRTPYLFADTARRVRWQQRLGGKVRSRIGLCWSGRGGIIPDRWRNMTARHFLPLLELPYDFHVVQKEIRPSDQVVLDVNKGLIPHADDIADFADTAALIAEMDLVITVDTAVAHVAGALGIPVWIILPLHPEWRWLLVREDSPWYPGARIMRPDADGWAGVISRIVHDLPAVC
ncbi:MAG: tetratricopeptide repeat-containing glycosyltransferase family protein [Rhizomicrobium sp.]